jgi:hypothetical protein
MRGRMVRAMLAGCGIGAWMGCSSGPSEQLEGSKSVPEAGQAPALAGPAVGGLLMVQAQFRKDAGKPVPGPARLEILTTDGTSWISEVIEDPRSNVFHKAVAWRGGILTIGAEDARLVHWTKNAGSYEPKVLWEKSWGGSFDRLRDLEVGDVTGDGREDLVIATHDMGVVAVGQESADGAWTFTELDPKPDTFVHEIEIGDVDGDGKAEFYATPSARNRASGESQPGGVVRYDYRDGTFVRTPVVEWTESHAKEILVADLDGAPGQELYAAREAHTVKGASGTAEIRDPVRIVRIGQADGAGFRPESTVATLDDRQCRFLVPADIDGDGRAELIAAGWKTGLYLLRPQADGSFASERFDAESTGFEHATFATDLNRDGKVEVYVAADDQRALRRYIWNGTSFDRSFVAAIPEGRITWNLQASNPR